MTSSNSVRRAVRHALFVSAMTAGASMSAFAADEATLDKVVVTGTRITMPGVESSSPIVSIGAAEIAQQQQPEVEKILRILPITAPGDGQNANNGSVGVTTVNLRGLGEQRNLIMIDGKRITPYNIDGIVDTSVIPTALIERIDIITGGASAVYGSDAISGAINVVLKKNFEGVDFTSNHSQTGVGDGDITSASLTVGSNVADGRGNVVISLNWTDREGVQLGARPLGLLGIVTADGGGYEQFLNGQPPSAPPAGCGGPGAVATTAGGSTTTVPTRLAITGGASLGQFRDNGTLGTNCSVFNFNPFNYYQTPQERFGGSAVGHFEVNEHADVYSSFIFSNTSVRQQVAPSGIFNTAYFTPLGNPFISASARATIITAAEAGRTAPAPTVVAGTNWRDLNTNGVVDVADDLQLSYRRRTGELGERSTTYNNNYFQLVLGTKGQIVDDWDYDVSIQHGQSDRTNVSAGYTNLTNVGNALDSVDGVTCRNGDTTCVPINLFGGYGTITPAMAGYAGASAIDKQNYTQTILNASVTGGIDLLKSPWASSPLAVSFGTEYREETGETTPDECWKLFPTSCLGGAGGFLSPIASGYQVMEFYGEAIFPLLQDVTGFQSLDIEVGYRVSDYDVTGESDTYKFGVNWKPIDQLRFRAMFQQAVRAPNVGELGSPITTGLDNAVSDPCSDGNLSISPALQAICISTGMTAGQVGVVQDIVSGQINGFFGTDQNALPDVETADTITIGFVWTPEFGGFIKNPSLQVDYYKINVDDFISEYGAQEVLDACYQSNVASECAKVRRLNGDLVSDGSGIELLTKNLNYITAEGIEIGFAFGIDIGAAGGLTFTGNVNKYLTQEYQSAEATPVVDCLGYYGTNCGGPLPEMRWNLDTTWELGDFSASLLWRHLGSSQIERPMLDADRNGTVDIYPQFQQIGSYDYFDLYGSWQMVEAVTLRASVSNLFEKDPPVVGNEAADTRSNSGNTFPSQFEVLGRVYTLGVNVKF